MLRVLIAIPAFNEEKAIPDVMSKLTRLYPHYEHLVINDCSTDKSCETARNHGARVLNLLSNLGIGGAVQTGFQYAARFDFDIMIQFDGDNQHPAEQIGDLVNAMTEKGADIVIGSRFIEKKGYTTEAARVPGVFILSAIVSHILGAPITDTTSGFRAFSRRAIRLFMNSYPRLYPEPECLVTAGRAGLIVKEIPVTMKRRESGTSSIGFWTGMHYMFTVVLNIGMEMLRKRREIAC